MNVAVVSGGGVRALCLVLGLAWLGACGASTGESGDEDCAGLLPGDVVVTEYLNDPEGTDTGQEYVEVHNPTRASVDLRGVTLYAARADGSQERAYVFAGTVPVAAGDYLVLGDVREGPLPAHVDLAYGEALGALGNTGGVLGLRCGERVLDEVRLASPGKSGVARTYDGRLVPDSEGNDDLTRWCDAPESSPASPRGSPGMANAPCSSLAPDGGSPDGGSADAGMDAGVVETCVPPGAVGPRAVLRPRPGELVITEVMANPRGDDALGEWVEVLATASVDLNGLTVGTDSAGTKVTAGHCLSLAAGEYAVLARQTEAVLNGGLPAPVATFAVDLRNSGGVVAVRAGGVLIDGVVYGVAEEGVATQVSAALADARRNDALEAWCRASDAYGNRGNLGTPGRPNRVCTAGGTADAGVVDAGVPGTGGVDAGVPGPGPVDAGVPGPSCIDRVTGRARALRAPDAGSLVLTEYMADPGAVADTVGEWVELLALRDVDLNGVTLANESASTVLTSALCLSMKAGGHAVIARSEEASLNGGLPAVLGTFAFNLVNGAGNHVLRLSVEGRVLDAVAYSTASTTGVSSQLNPTVRDPSGNDAPGSFCVAPASARYGAGDRGTPGVENRPCAP